MSICTATLWHLDSLAVSSVIDMASGEGYGSAILAQSALSVIGIDVNEQAVQHAQKNYYIPNLRFLCAACEAIPLADSSVDVVVSFETIEHVEDYRQMLREIRRVLKADGTLIISSPNKLIYTDQAGHENPFDVSELYYSEFRDALALHFDNIEMFGQRIAAASVVSPLGTSSTSSAQWLTGGIRRVESGLPSLDDPVYFIAICSNTELEDSNLSPALIDSETDLIQDIWVEVARLRDQLDSRALSASQGAGCHSQCWLQSLRSNKRIRPARSIPSTSVGKWNKQRTLITTITSAY